MESKRLISVLTFSEKRRDTLFLLLREPMTLSEIRNYFNISSPEILPRIKELEVKNLIRALLTVGEYPKSSVIQKYIKWLINTQNSDGTGITTTYLVTIQLFMPIHCFRIHALLKHLINIKNLSKKAGEVYEPNMGLFI